MWVSKQKGFTIVELLIVIVVIAILAAISIVAYNGIQTRARTSAVSSALSQVSKKLATLAVDSNSYPADLTSAGITNTNDVTYQYSVNNSANPATYCVTATSGTISYKVSSTAPAPAPGGCAGHGQGGSPAITNYAIDPNAAGSGTGGFSSAGSGPIATTTTIASDRSHKGTTSLKKVVTGASGYTAVMANTPPSDRLRVNAGEKIQWSFWVYSTKAGTPTVYWQGAKVSDGTYTGGSSGTPPVPANTWTQLTGSFTPTFDVYVSNAGMYNFTVVSGDTLWFDEFMVTKGDSLPNYADGDSTDWTWNGTANNATSTGPAQ